MLELLIALAVMSTTLLAVAFAFERASESYEEGQVDRAIEAQSHRALDFIARQFIDSGTGSFTVPPPPGLGASTLTFRRATGYDGANVQWGDFLTLMLDLEEGEFDDGLDNNNNGLVDERVLQQVRNLGQPDEERQVVTHWVRELAAGELPGGGDENGNGLVDEQGLSFALQGNVLAVRLTLERIGSKGRTVTSTVETSVRLRN